jgi:hypothetical protein
VLERDVVVRSTSLDFPTPYSRIPGVATRTTKGTRPKRVVYGLSATAGGSKERQADNPGGEGSTALDDGTAGLVLDVSK